MLRPCAATATSMSVAGSLRAFRPWRCRCPPVWPAPRWHLALAAGQSRWTVICPTLQSCCTASWPKPCKADRRGARPSRDLPSLRYHCDQGLFMALNYETLLASPPAIKHQAYEARDSIIYALGVGLGAEHEDERQLRYLWERDLLALPTSASTLAWTRFADLDIGMTYTKIVHAEQRMVIHKPVPPTGSVTSELRVKDVVDRGEAKGAMIYFERKLIDDSDKSVISTQILSILAR
ncbi:MAG: hypothetical protein FP826_08535 [Sphingomonadales bacterium]|nr:hypothetical protein [Sphingomonadales bacterium]